MVVEKDCTIFLVSGTVTPRNTSHSPYSPGHVLKNRRAQRAFSVFHFFLNSFWMGSIMLIDEIIDFLKCARIGEYRIVSGSFYVHHILFCLSSIYKFLRVSIRNNRIIFSNNEKYFPCIPLNNLLGIEFMFQKNGYWKVRVVCFCK